MRSFFRTYKTETIIFFVALCVRLFFFLVALALSGALDFSFPSIGSDSQDYLMAARGFLEYGSFFNISSQLPNSYEMPLYPLFLAFVSKLGMSILVVSLLQDILMAFVAVMIYRIGLRVSHFVARVGTVLFVFDPANIFYSNFIVTEPFFIFFTVLAVYVLVESVFKTAKKNFFISGLLLGLATMVRPVGIMLIPGVVIFLLLTKNVSWRLIALRSCLFLIGLLVVVFPYMVRNKIIFDKWDLSSVAAWQFLYSHAAHYYAYQNEISVRDAEDIFHQRLAESVPERYTEYVKNFKSGTLFISPYMWDISLGYLKQDPLGYAFWHGLKTLPFFVSDGLRDLAQRMHLIKLDQPSFTNLLISKNFVGLREAVFESTGTFILLVIGFGVWFLLTLFQCLGFAVAYSHKGFARGLVFACLLFIITTAAVAGGAVAHSRYRMSVSPFMFLVAAYGIEHMLKKYHWHIDSAT